MSMIDTVGDAIFADIYFHQRNAREHHAALDLRDAILRLRRDGAFVAVPLFYVYPDPMGPHPVGEYTSCLSKEPFTADFPFPGSYEIWVPAESFVSVFSYICMNRGDLRYSSDISHL